MVLSFPSHLRVIDQKQVLAYSYRYSNSLKYWWSAVEMFLSCAECNMYSGV